MPRQRLLDGNIPLDYVWVLIIGRDERVGLGGIRISNNSVGGDRTGGGWREAVLKSPEAPIGQENSRIRVPVRCRVRIVRSYRVVIRICIIRERRVTEPRSDAQHGA